jgi:hypothetical protein
MAVTKLVYDDMPPVPKRRPKRPAQPQPYTAQAPHQFWCIDGRQRDLTLEGLTWWSIII